MQNFFFYLDLSKGREQKESCHFNSFLPRKIRLAQGTFNHVFTEKCCPQSIHSVFCDTEGRFCLSQPQKELESDGLVDHSEHLFKAAPEIDSTSRCTPQRSWLHGYHFAVLVERDGASVFDSPGCQLNQRF